jgi:hypothetical protein
MREVFQKLLNEAMKVERAEALGADLYERTPDPHWIRQRVQT